MSIFKRQGEGQQTGATPDPETGAVPDAGVEESQAAQQTKLMPPFVSAPRAAAPGVVPPAAALTFEMTPPESAARAEGDTATLVAERVKTAREAQQGAQDVVQEKVRVAVQRARTTASATAMRRRATALSAGARRAQHRPSFDALRAAQAGLLSLAWSWQQAGSTVRAIHAYMQVLSRYPDTPAADAAVADLVELSDILAGEGQFHLALGIYDRLEELI